MARSASLVVRSVNAREPMTIDCYQNIGSVVVCNTYAKYIISSSLALELSATLQQQGNLSAPVRIPKAHATNCHMLQRSIGC